MNPDKVYDYSEELMSQAEQKGLMHSAFKRISSTEIEINSKTLISFLNCSYLNLDYHPLVVNAAVQMIKNYGIHYCCSRSRTSMEPLMLMEDHLSRLLKGHAVSFPSVTTTHSAVFPLLASNLFGGHRDKVFIFDQFAHSSMQVHKKMLSQKADVLKIEHNNMNQLEDLLKKNSLKKKIIYYFCDGVYSIGSKAPIDPLFLLSDKYGLKLYIDDAHGTLIYGKKNEGYVSRFFNDIPDFLMFNFSLAKGFGGNGGGIVVGNRHDESIIRRFSLQYNFSGPVDFSVVGAVLKVFNLINSGEVARRVGKLRDNIKIFDSKMGLNFDPHNPIRMALVEGEDQAVNNAGKLFDKGILLSCAFFPVVPKKKAQYRICLNADHSQKQILKLTDWLKSNNLSKFLNYENI